MLISRQNKIDYIKQSFGKDAKTGLEISPSINPMITHKDGYGIYYLDACTTEELRQRAISKGRSTDCAPIIDYVYDFRKSIASCVSNKKFDFVVSSHVIEHIPNLIGHFREVEEVLEEGGIYAFLAPDKDLCFDAKKPNSSLGQLIEAYVENRKVAPVSALIDEYYYGVQRAGNGAWSEDETAPFRPKYNTVNKLISDVIKNPNMTENWHGHIWKFTPTSFKDLFFELNMLGLVQLKLCEIVPTNRMEFVAILRS